MKYQNRPACEECPFNQNKIIFPISPNESRFQGLIFLIDSLTKRDQESGIIWGKAGGCSKPIKSTLKVFNYDLEQVGVYATTACYPPQDCSPEDYQRARDCCKEVLREEFFDINAKIVMALGNESWNQLTGLKSVDAYRGTYLPPSEEDPWWSTCTLEPNGIFFVPARSTLVDFIFSDIKKAIDALPLIHQGIFKLFEPDIRDANDVKGLLKFLDNCNTKKVIGCDIETDGIDPLTLELKTIGIAAHDSLLQPPIAYSIPYKEFYSSTQWAQIEKRLLKLFNNKKLHIVFHNKQFDVPALQRVFNVKMKATLDDTMVMHHDCYPKVAHKLQKVASQFLYLEPWKSDFKGDEDHTFDSMSGALQDADLLSKLFWYNAFDTAVTLELYHKLLMELKINEVEKVYDIDQKLSTLTIDWYERGILIDLREKESIAKVLSKEVADLEQELITTSGVENFNPRSPKQLKVVLNTMGLAPTKVTKKTGDVSTSKDSLWDLRDNPFIACLLSYREKQKLYSTYILNIEDKLHTDKRLHPSWNLTATPSGRFGTSPNVQNWPKAVRKMFKAPIGWSIIGCDYKALELRWIALASGETYLIDAFNNEADIHYAHAELFFGDMFREASDAVKKELRARGKNVTFGKNYRAGVEALYDQIKEKMPNVKTSFEREQLKKEIGAMSRILDGRYPNIVKWANLQAELANKYYHLRTAILGRLRKWPLGNAIVTECANHPVQGTAADIVNMATIKLVDTLEKLGYYNKYCYIIFQVHDALYFEVKNSHVEEVRKIIEECMTTEVTYKSPVTNKVNTLRFSVESNVGKTVYDA